MQAKVSRRYIMRNQMSCAFELLGWRPTRCLDDHFGNGRGARTLRHAVPQAPRGCLTHRTATVFIMILSARMSIVRIVDLYFDESLLAGFKPDIIRCNQFWAKALPADWTPFSTIVLV